MKNVEQIFYSQYVRPPKVCVEINSGKKLVETAGYIPAQIRIENLINAGMRLADFRSDQFDFPDGRFPEDYEDVTRKPSFDMADASQIANSIDINKTIENIKSAKKNKQKEEYVDEKNSDFRSKVPIDDSDNTYKGRDRRKQGDRMVEKKD